MSIALYCRVSTEEQAATGFSIDHQQSRLAAFCASQGWDKFSFYIDDGYTGTNLKRPQMQRLISDIQAGVIKIVVVYRLDRLSRHQKDVLFLLEDLFEQNHVVFKSATEPFDTSTPLGRAMIGILAVFGQLERDTIVERTKSGKEERTSQGLWYGGPVPYGYEWSSSEQKLLVIPDQAQLIQETFQQFLTGWTYRSIGRWLSERTSDRKFNSHKTVSYIISNPIYTGNLQYAGKLYAGIHEAIISMKIFKAASEERLRRQRTRNRYAPYLLSHLLVCAHCGATMIHIQAKDNRGVHLKIRGYYVCGNKHRRSVNCENKWFREEDVEMEVVHQIGSLLIDSNEERLQTRVPVGSQYTVRLQAQLNIINKKLKKWYALFDTEVLNFETMRTHVDSLEQAKQRITLSIANQQPFIESAPTIQTDLPIAAFWPYFTATEHKKIVDSAIVRILIGVGFPLTIEWNA